MAVTGSLTDLAAYLNNGYWAWSNYQGTQPRHWSAGATVSVNITDLNANEQAFALQALAAFQAVANINFSFTTGAAQITYLNNGSGIARCAQTVSGTSLTSATITISSNWGDPTVNQSYMWQTYLHETGHALGLGHQGPYNNSATYGVHNIYTNDSWQLSLMSYFSQSQASTGSHAYVANLQTVDILAMQTHYGARAARTGDTVYGYNSNAGFGFNFSGANNFAGAAFTIYDSGGTDTLDCSLWSGAQTIDLRSGFFSSVLGETNNIGIYTTSVVENAIGGSGSDILRGNSANNTLIGNAGHDSFYGDSGFDYFEGGLGGDTFDGGAEFDFVAYRTALAGVAVYLSNPSLNTGDAAGDTFVSIEGIDGSDYDDVLSGTNQANEFFGNDGVDQIYGLDGADSFYGGAGNDYLNGGLGGDLLHGGGDFDYASYTTAGAAVTARLDNSALNTGEAAGDTYDLIEGLVGSGYNDNLIGNADLNRLWGKAGGDSLYGLGGTDYLYGEAGTDYLNGGLGGDLLNGGLDLDYASYTTATAGVVARLDNPNLNTGEAAGDIYNSIEGLVGSNYGDTLVGNGDANRLYGRSGNDYIYGGLGNDVLSGELGNDRLVAGPGNDSLYGGANVDVFVFNSALNGSTNVDTIFDFSSPADTIFLDNAFFRVFTAETTLNAAYFRANSTGRAQDGNDYIVYNTTTGALTYDLDGSRAGAAVRFAQMSGAPTLTNLDFVII